MALTRRKKIGPMRFGMKRTTTTSVANQVVRPARRHQKSPSGGASAQDRMGEGKPVGGDAHPVNYG